MECVEPDRVGELQIAVDELSELMVKYLGAEVSACAILTKDKTEIEL
jgi:hypothetical protein